MVWNGRHLIFLQQFVRVLEQDLEPYKKVRLQSKLSQYNRSIFCKFLSLSLLVVSSATLAGNGLQLQEVGDFEAQNCLPVLNFDTKHKTSFNH